MFPENPAVENGDTVEQHEPLPTLEPTPIFTEIPFEPVPFILNEILEDCEFVLISLF